mgnify:FL=1
MSERVEDRLAEILGDVASDPFGNPIPGSRADHPAPGKDELSANRVVRDGVGSAVVRRIGEPIQADAELLALLEDAGICAGAQVELRGSAGGVRVVGPTGMPIVLPGDVARHLFLEQAAPER